MNARTKSELLKQDGLVSLQTDGLSRLTSRQRSVPDQMRFSESQAINKKEVSHDKRNHPVIRHLDNLQEQLSEQLDSLNTVMSSMQRISDVMERMAKKRCTLNGSTAACKEKK
jgi:flagellar capping protein FliD